MTTIKIPPTPRVYVGTYAKYNNGSISGKWLDLDDYVDLSDFEEACQSLHADESDPELMFQDWENVPSIYVGESYVSDEFWEYWNYINERHADYEAVNAYIEYFGVFSAEGFEDAYAGKSDSLEDWAVQRVSDLGLLENVPEALAQYFDYKAYGRDFEASGYLRKSNGYWFYTS